MTLDDLDKAQDRLNDALHYRREPDEEIIRVPNEESTSTSFTYISILRPKWNRETKTNETESAKDHLSLYPKCTNCAARLLDNVSVRVKLCIKCRENYFIESRKNTVPPQIEISIIVRPPHGNVFGGWASLLRYKHHEKIMARKVSPIGEEEHLFRIALTDTLKALRKPCDILLHFDQPRRTDWPCEGFNYNCNTNTPNGWRDIFMEAYQNKFYVKQTSIEQEDRGKLIALLEATLRN